MSVAAPTAGSLRKAIDLKSATALVIANIIGAGIFTSTGFQAAALGHPGYIFLLWGVGGMLAFCGALSYSEMGAAMPEAGGEYVYLRETYGSIPAFISGFVSLIAGFSAPIASALKSLARYLAHFFPILGTDPAVLGIPLSDLTALGFCWLLVAIHLRGVRGGIKFNNIATLFKVAGITGIVIAAVVIGRGNTQNLTYVSASFENMSGADRMGAFANSLIFVMFCYSGWNAAAYVAGEIEDPGRNLPRSLLLGTGTVMLLYLALNVVYLYGADVDQLANKTEVGLVTARNLFGHWGASLVTVVLAVSLLASASAMTVAGPRVYYAAGRNFPRLQFLAKTAERSGSPRVALILQGAVTSLLILSGRVDQLQQYVGFTLTLFAGIAISCLLVLRLTRPQMNRPFRTWGYPIAPLLFLTISVWTLVWNFRGRPIESVLALVTIIGGGIVFYVFIRHPRDEIH